MHTEQDVVGVSLNSSELFLANARLAAAAIAVLSGLPGDAHFMRGDGNADGEVDISDSVFTLTYLFGGGAAPACEDAADTNDDGRIDLSDAAAGLIHLFGSGFVLPEPAGVCGADPTADRLSCDDFVHCDGD